MSKVRRIGKGKHPFIGPYVIAEVRTVRGGDGRYIEDWTRSLYPVLQVNGFGHRPMHPRHPTGYDIETGVVNSCVSPSCSFYSDLCSYAGFRWTEPKASEA